MLPGFKIELLASHHRRDQFTCASTSLNDFIQKTARMQNANNTTRVHVLADARGRVAAYYTLSAHTLELSGLPDSLQKGRPRFPVPATLLGRFAVDNEFTGGHLGDWLLAHALLTAYAASKSVGSAMVVVDIAEDATSNAERLYEKYGFVALPSNSRRLILTMVTIERNST